MNPADLFFKNKCLMQKKTFLTPYCSTVAPLDRNQPPPSLTQKAASIMHSPAFPEPVRGLERTNRRSLTVVKVL